METYKIYFLKYEAIHDTERGIFDRNHNQDIPVFAIAQYAGEARQGHPQLRNYHTDPLTQC